MSEILIPTISLWQPWAAALVVGRHDQPEKALKGWETRGWKIPAKFLGKRMLIHAAKKDDKVTTKMLNSFPLNSPGNHRAISAALHYGAIVGYVIFTECITTEEWLSKFGNIANAQEQALGDYTPGRFAWRADAKFLFSKPTHTRGFQKIWGTPVSQLPSEYHFLFPC